MTRTSSRRPTRHSTRRSCGAARNSLLERQWSFLEPYSRTYLTVSQPGLDLLALSERHVPILDALRARDGDAAAEAMHRHLMEAAELLKEPA